MSDLLAQLDEKSRRADKLDLGDLSGINLDDISVPPEPAKPVSPRRRPKKKAGDAKAKSAGEKASANGKAEDDGNDGNECEADAADAAEGRNGAGPENEEASHKRKRSFLDLSILDTLAKLSRRKKGGEEQAQVRR